MPVPARRQRRAARSPSWAAAACSGPDVTLSHCTRLSDADFDAIAVVVDRGGAHPGERHGRAATGPPPMQQLIDRGIRPGLGRRRRAARPRRCLRPDARRHLRAARHDVRPQAGGQGGAPQPARHPRRHPLRHHRWREGCRALRHHRLAQPGQARRRHRVATPTAPTSPPSTTRSVPSCGAWTRRTSTGSSSAARHWSSTASSPPTWRGHEPLARGGPASGRRPAAGVPAGAGAAARHASSTRTMPSAAVTRFVVASRYMPAYLALALLVVVAAIWVPETLSPVALSAIAPFAALLAITALGQMLVIMTGRHRSQHAGHADARGDDRGRSRRAVRQPHLDRDPHGGRPPVPSSGW